MRLFSQVLKDIIKNVHNYILLIIAATIPVLVVGALLYMAVMSIVLLLTTMF